MGGTSLHIRPMHGKAGPCRGRFRDYNLQIFDHLRSVFYDFYIVRCEGSRAVVRGLAQWRGARGWKREMPGNYRSQHSSVSPTGRPSPGQVPSGAESNTDEDRNSGGSSEASRRAVSARRPSQPPSPSVLRDSGGPFQLTADVVFSPSIVPVSAAQRREEWSSLTRDTNSLTAEAVPDGTTPAQTLTADLAS